MEIGSIAWKHLILDGARALDIELEPEKADQFAVHARELIAWTRKTNLTAITDPTEVAVKHFLDSIAPAPWIPPTASVLDIGSGGGFPGIPLKILMPSLTVTLIDASRKKVSFLKHVIRTLRLHGAIAFQTRAEDLAKDQAFAHAFDIVVSRALCAPAEFVSMASPLAAKEGLMIAFTGKDPYLPEADQRKFSLIIKSYTLPYLGSERTLVIIRNTR